MKTTKRFLVEYVYNTEYLGYECEGEGVYRGNTAQEAIQRMLTKVIEFGGLESCALASYTATELELA